MGQWSLERYETFCSEEIERTVRFQEEIGLDVLVHGEFERADMVEYFGEQLQGFAQRPTAGCRATGPVRQAADPLRRRLPPAADDGSLEPVRPSLTSRPMKGMLTGPMTILQWSFIRDDQPRRNTAFQIALGVRDELVDLETAGIV